MTRLSYRALCARRRLREGGADSGFTLIELLVVITILPLVVGAITVALLSVITQQTTATNKVSDSQDTQTVSQNFVQDVQNAFALTTNSAVTSPTTCGSHTPILSMYWGSAPIVVSYDVVTVGNSNYLYRELCTNGGNTTPTSSRAIAYDVQNNLSSSLTINGKSCPPSSVSCYNGTAQQAAAAGWASAVGVTSVQLAVTPQLKGDTVYSYALAGVPRVSSSSSRGFTQPPGHPTALSLGGSGDSVQCAGSSNAGITVDGTLQINSTSNPGPVASTNNNASISAVQIDTGSTSTTSLSGNVSPSTPSQTGVTVTDPYQGMTPPVSGLTTATLTVGGTYQGYHVYAGTYSGPGIYTGSLTFPNGTTTMASGVYVLMAGMSITGLNTVQSDPNGVLIYIYRQSISIAGNGTLSIGPFASTATPYTGAPSPWPGIVIWQDGAGTQGGSDAGDSTTMALSGNGGADLITGTVYAPDAAVGTGGNGALTVGSIVSSSIACGGNGSFTIG